MEEEPHSPGTYTLGLILGAGLAYLAILVAPSSINPLLVSLPGLAAMWWGLNGLIRGYIGRVIRAYRDRERKRQS